MAKRKINWEGQPLLGVVPDAKLAARLGVTPQTVSAARRKYANVIAARTQNAAISKITDNPDGLRICRDDRCGRLDIHAAHPISEEVQDLFYDVVYPHKHDRHGKTLREIVYTHVPLRYCKPFRALYDDVIEDYGGFVSNTAGVRAVWRAVSDLVARSKIVNVGAGAPQTPGGYIRSDSPLLQDEDGWLCLLESLEDIRPTARS